MLRELHILLAMLESVIGELVGLQVYFLGDNYLFDFCFHFFGFFVFTYFEASHFFAEIHA